MEARHRREREQQLIEAAVSKDAENNNQPAQKEVPLTDLETKVADNIADTPLETKAVEDNINSSDSNSLKNDDAANQKSETQGSQTNSDDVENDLENSLPRQHSKNGDEALHSKNPNILNVAEKEGSEKPGQFQNEMKPESSSEQIKNKRFNNQETLSDPKIDETDKKFDGNSDKAKGVREQKVEEHEQPVNSDSSVQVKFCYCSTVIHDFVMTLSLFKNYVMHKQLVFAILGSKCQCSLQFKTTKLFVFFSMIQCDSML